jgi:hypothetical protein
VVWPPEPCADEMPDPELLDDPDEAEVPDDPELPELLDDPELAEPVPDELLLPAEELPVPLPLAVLVWCVPAGRAKATAPAPASPTAPTVTVTARSRACPRRRAAAADRAFGSAVFIGIPSWILTTVWMPGLGAASTPPLTFLRTYGPAAAALVSVWCRGFRPAGRRRW